MSRPLLYKIYKGIGGKYGALQFALKPGYYECSACKKVNDVPFHKDTCTANPPGEMVQENGCIFVEICSATGKNQYDWKNKIVLALNIGDISNLLYGFSKGEQVEIFHDPNMGNAGKGKVAKKLSFLAASDGRGGYIVVATQTNQGGKDKLEHKVPLMAPEVRTLKTLLEAALPRMLLWS